MFIYIYPIGRIAMSQHGCRSMCQVQGMPCRVCNERLFLHMQAPQAVSDWQAVLLELHWVNARSATKLRCSHSYTVWGSDELHGILHARHKQYMLNWTLPVHRSERHQQQVICMSTCQPSRPIARQRQYHQCGEGGWGVFGRILPGRSFGQPLRKDPSSCLSLCRIPYTHGHFRERQSFVKCAGGRSGNRVVSLKDTVFGHGQKHLVYFRNGLGACQKANQQSI